MALLENNNIEEQIAKYLSGNMGREELEQFNVWLAQSQENKETLERYRLAWELLDSPEEIDVQRAWEKISERLDLNGHKVIPMYGQTWFKVAASVVLVFVSVFVLWRLVGVFSEPDRLSFEAESFVKEFDLPDESKVSLKTGSKLVLLEDFGSAERKVNLKGTGFFEVERNEQKPFLVETDYGSVKVLGTSFLVQTDTLEELTLVYVESGKVLVFPDDDPLKGVELKVHESAEVSPGQVRKIQIGNTNIIAWKSKKIKFKDQSLESVFKELGEIYGYSFDLDEEEIQGCKFTGRFNGLELRLILEQLKDLYQFDYTITDKEVIINGGGC